MILNFENEEFCRQETSEHFEIPVGVTKVPKMKFHNQSKLTSITIPDSVTTIGDDAFDCCEHLIEVKYNGTVEEWNKIKLGNDVFTHTKVTKITCTDREIEI